MHVFLLICCWIIAIHSVNTRPAIKDTAEHIVSVHQDDVMADLESRDISTEILVPGDYFLLPKSLRAVKRLVEGLPDILCRVLDKRSNKSAVLPCSAVRDDHDILHSRHKAVHDNHQPPPCRHDVTMCSNNQQLQQLHSFMATRGCLDEETEQLMSKVSRLLTRFELTLQPRDVDSIGTLQPRVQKRRYHKLLHMRCDVMVAYDNCKRRTTTTTLPPASTTTTSTTTRGATTTIHQQSSSLDQYYSRRSRFDWDISNIDYDGELFDDPFLFY